MRKVLFVVFLRWRYYSSFAAARANEFIGSLLSSTTARPVQVPPGLSSLQEELGHICGTLLRLVSHNRAVFGEYYADIITNHIKGVKTIAGVRKKEEQEKEGEDEAQANGDPV